MLLHEQAAVRERPALEVVELTNQVLNAAEQAELLFREASFCQGQRLGTEHELVARQHGIRSFNNLRYLQQSPKRRQDGLVRF